MMNTIARKTNSVTGFGRGTTLTEPRTVMGGTGSVGAALHESVYRQAAGDIKKVPWARGKANPMLVAWLNAEATGMVRPGARAVVVGCGLGDDVIELVNRGYDATGFDVSPTAIEWARKRFPDHGAEFVVGDLLSLPSRFRHRFDLVVECNTLQSVDPGLREGAATAIAQLTCPRGLVLAIARGRDEGELLEQVQGPPWPLTPGEFAGLFEASGMQPVKAIDDFQDEQAPPVRRLRGAFTHA